MKLQYFYTADRSSLVNRLIMRACGADYAHVGPMFTLTQADMQVVCDLMRRDVPVGLYDEIYLWPCGQYRMYFESIWSMDGRTRKTGVRGPYCYSKLVKWAGESEHRVLDLQDVLGLSESDIWMALQKALDAVPFIRYAKLQLWSNWKRLRLGAGIRPSMRTRDKYTCVEYCAVILPPWYQVDVLDCLYNLIEELPPSSGRIGGLRERVEAHNEAIRGE